MKITDKSRPEDAKALCRILAYPGPNGLDDFNALMAQDPFPFRFLGVRRFREDPSWRFVGFGDLGHLGGVWAFKIRFHEGRWEVDRAWEYIRFGEPPKPAQWEPLPWTMAHSIATRAAYYDPETMDTAHFDLDGNRVEARPSEPPSLEEVQPTPQEGHPADDRDAHHWRMVAQEAMCP